MCVLDLSGLGEGQLACSLNDVMKVWEAQNGETVSVAEGLLAVLEGLLAVLEGLLAVLEGMSSSERLAQLFGDRNVRMAETFKEGITCTRLSRVQFRSSSISMFGISSFNDPRFNIVALTFRAWYSDSVKFSRHLMLTAFVLNGMKLSFNRVVCYVPPKEFEFY